MKNLQITLFAVAISLSSLANAQHPRVRIYFDEGLNFTTANCPQAPIGTVTQELYVVAENFDIWMNAIEYTISYPPQLIFLGDILEPGDLSIGNSQTGIAIAFPIPRNAFTKMVVQRVFALWMCSGCVHPNWDAPIDVYGYPPRGLIRAVEWPNLNVHVAWGIESIICWAMPVHETTWGGIKALYR